MDVILLAPATVGGEARQVGDRIPVTRRDAGWQEAEALLNRGLAMRAPEHELAAPSAADAAILAACAAAAWDVAGDKVLLLPRAPLPIAGDFRGVGRVARLPGALADLLLAAGEARELLPPPPDAVGPSGLRPPRADGEPLGDFIRDAIDNDPLALALAGPVEKPAWRSADEFDRSGAPAHLIRESLDAPTDDDSEPMPPLRLATARAHAAGFWPTGGVVLSHANAHNWPHLKVHAMRAWGLLRPDIAACRRVRGAGYDVGELARAEREYLARIGVRHGTHRRRALLVDLFEALRAGAFVAHAIHAESPDWTRISLPSRWWASSAMVVRWKAASAGRVAEAELAPRHEMHARYPHFRDIVLFPVVSEAAQAAPSAPVDISTRKPRKGGRPEKWNRLKISAALTRHVSDDPNGIPEDMAERRELVRRICVKLYGEEPADSTLAEIMDDLELR